MERSYDKKSQVSSWKFLDVEIKPPKSETKRELNSISIESFYRAYPTCGRNVADIGDGLRAAENFARSGAWWCNGVLGGGCGAQSGRMALEGGADEQGAHGLVRIIATRQ